MLRIYRELHRAGWLPYIISREGRFETVREKVQAALDQVRPMLQRDGGDVVLVDVTPDGLVKVKLTGACGG